MAWPEGARCLVDHPGQHMPRRNERLLLPALSMEAAGEHSDSGAT